MTSYDANAQVHQTFDLWEKHGDKCVYVRIPDRRFDIFLIRFGTYMSRCSNKQSNWCGGTCILILIAYHFLGAQVHQ